MSATQVNPTSDEARSLADKLADFDRSLTPGERALFRYKIQDAIRAEVDVDGHRMEGRWGSDETGIYFTWVSVEDEAPNPIDRSRRNTLSGSESDVTASNAARTAENTA